MMHLLTQHCRYYLLLIASVAILYGCANTPAQRVNADANREKWGLKLVSLRPSVAGYMLDLRYRILDAKKAAPLMDRKLRPYLIVEADGRKLSVPVTNKLGAMRQTTKYPRANRNYFMLFANPGRHVKSGDLVTVVIGDYRATHVVVN